MVGESLAKNRQQSVAEEPKALPILRRRAVVHRASASPTMGRLGYLKQFCDLLYAQDRRESWRLGWDRKRSEQVRDWLTSGRCPFSDMVFSVDRRATFWIALNERR